MFKVICRKPPTQAELQTLLDFQKEEGKRKKEKRKKVILVLLQVTPGPMRRLDKSIHVKAA